MEKVYILWVIDPSRSYGDTTEKDIVGVFATMEAIDRYVKLNPLRGIYSYYDWEEFEVVK